MELSARTIGEDASGDMCLRLGHTFVKLGEYDNALHWFTVGVERMQKNDDPDQSNFAIGLYNKGNCLLDLGRPTEAIVSLKESLDLLTKEVGEENEIVADILFSLASAHQMESDYYRSLDLYSESSNVLDTVVTDHSVPAARITHTKKMAECYFRVGRYDATLELCREVLQLPRSSFDSIGTGRALSIRADILDYFGVICRHKGELEPALQYLHKAIAIRRGLGPFGENRIMIARELYEMALVRSARIEGNEKERANVDLLLDGSIKLCERYLYDESSPTDSWNASIESPSSTAVLEQVNDFFVREGGGKSIFLANAASFWGKVLLHKRELDSVGQILDFALKVYSITFTSNHQSVGDVLFCQGVLHFMKKHYNEALRCFDEAYVIRRKRLNNNHVDIEETLRFIGAVQMELGKSEQSIECFKNAMFIREARAGKRGGCDDNADNLLQIGRMHQEKENFDFARKMYERALQIRLRSRNHKQVGEVMFALGTLFLDLGVYSLAHLRFADALTLYTKSGATMEVADVLFNMVRG